MKCVALLVACGLFVGTAARLGFSADPPSVDSVLSAMESANDYFMGGNPSWDCSWTRGTYFAGDFEHALVAEENGKDASKYFGYLLAEGEHYGWETCSWDHHSINANDMAIGQAYLRLASLKHNQTYANGVLADLAVQMASSAPPWSWIDAVFMAAPTFALAANFTGNQTYNQFGYDYFSETAVGAYHLWDSSVGFFYRDDTYIGKKCPNGAPVMWARGNGWASVAMARVHAFTTDATNPNRATYASYLSKLADSLRSVQGSDGLWRSSLLDAEEYPNPETTGSALFTAALAYGVRAGILDSSFADIVFHAWQGLATVSLQPSGLVGYCQPAAGSPGPASQSSTSDFCVGQFLMAGAEVIRLVKHLQENQ